MDILRQNHKEQQRGFRLQQQSLGTKGTKDCWKKKKVIICYRKHIKGGEKNPNQPGWEAELSGKFARL